MRQLEGRQRGAWSGEDGVSLTELAAVMAIIAVMTAIATVTTVNYLPAATVRWSAQEFQGALSRAKMLAVTTRPPGAAMTFNGRIHANSSIYLGPESSLDIDSYMTTAATIYRRIKRDPAGTTHHGNDPQIKDANGMYRSLNFDHDYNQNFTSTWPESAWTSQARNTFGPSGTDSTVKDGTMGVGPITGMGDTSDEPPNTASAIL